MPFAVHREFLTADPHVRVAAGHVMVTRGFDLFRTGNAGAIAVRDHYRVCTHPSLDATEQQVVPPAAPGENERSGANQDSPDSHGYNCKLLFAAKSRRVRA